MAPAGVTNSGADRTSVSSLNTFRYIGLTGLPSLDTTTIAPAAIFFSASSFSTFFPSAVVIARSFTSPSSTVATSVVATSRSIFWTAPVASIWLTVTFRVVARTTLTVSLPLPSGLNSCTRGAGPVATGGVGAGTGAPSTSESARVVII